jgi:hypothetical protein
MRRPERRGLVPKEPTRYCLARVSLKMTGSAGSLTPMANTLASVQPPSPFRRG